MTNRITVYGRLGKDAEIKDVNGKRVLELSIASNHKAKGEEIAVWRRATFWDDNYRNIEPYLKKGAALIVRGEELPPRVYEGKAQLSVRGTDLQFNPFGSGSGDKKENNSYVAKPMAEEQKLPGLAPC